LRRIIGDVVAGILRPAIELSARDLLRRLASAELDEERDALILDRLDRLFNL